VSEALSIRAAARDAGAAAALHVGERSFTFAELAERAAPRIAELGSSRAPLPLTATNSLDTLATLLALLELQRPVLILHPKLTEAERAREIESTERAAASLPTDAAIVLYTSGTSGQARGAVLTRAALLASARASGANLGWADDDCWLLAMPLARVGGLAIVVRCLAARRAIAMETFDATLLPQWIARHRVTLLSLVPTMLAQVLDAHPDWRPPPHLRALLLGGAAAPPKLLARAAERGWPIVITYGCTETGSQVVATPYAQRFATAECGVGRPLSDVELRIDNGRILVRGPMRMTGYLGEPALDPDAWFDTGDVGLVDERGFLHLAGRRTDLIVTGGENVYPAEVEQVLEDCPGVRAAAVFGLADETWGQVVAAALVVEDPPTDEMLLEHLTTRLAPFKRPRQIGLVPALPYTPAGKLDRAALAALAPSLRPLRANS
jgi:O-succinylbenzoic acid--CoA ligase